MSLAASNNSNVNNNGQNTDSSIDFDSYFSKDNSASFKFSTGVSKKSAFSGSSPNRTSLQRLQRARYHLQPISKKLQFNNGGNASPSSVTLSLSPTPGSPGEKFEKVENTVIHVDNVLEQLKGKLQGLEGLALTTHAVDVTKGQQPNLFLGQLGIKLKDSSTKTVDDEENPPADAVAVPKKVGTKGKQIKKQGKLGAPTGKAAATPESKKTDINVTEAFHASIDAGDIAKCDFYLNTGTDINIKDDRGETALHKSLKLGNLQLATHLISRGADISAKTYMEVCALHFCASYGQLECAKLLISKGANTTACDWSGRNCLHKASEYGQQHMVKFFMSLPQVGVNTKDSYGETALHFAALNGHEEVVEFLLANGADSQIKNTAGEKVLLKAIKSENTNVVDIVFRSEPTSESDQLQNDPVLLQKSYDNQNINIFKYLLFSGANMNTLQQVTAQQEELQVLKVDSRIKKLIKDTPVLATIRCMHSLYTYPDIDSVIDLLEFL